MAVVTVAAEGPTDFPVLRRLLSEAGHQIAFTYGGSGKQALDRDLGGYNAAARFTPWLVLRDLDHDEPCASALAGRLLPSPAPHMRLRIAVRETESWLMADAEALAEFLSVSPASIPLAPDALNDPKGELVNLARRSRRRDIREDMAPRPGFTAVVGPAYGSRLAEFVRMHWRPSVAAERSPSLRRTLQRLRTSWGTSRGDP